MILWCDGAHSAADNMRRDQELLRRLDDPAGGSEAVLRLFQFDPPGITLGYAQRPERELDLDRCAEDGVRWAIRPTGGRAIYHDEEWTYSFAARIDDPVWGGSLDQTYQRLAGLIVASLERLGVDVAVANRGGRGEPARRESGSAAPCFASTTRHEIVWNGRKLVGSAQRRLARAFLQQGSLLLSDSHLRLCDYLAVPEEARARLRDRLRAASAHLGAELGPRAALERWAGALAEVLPAGVRIENGDRALPLTV
ncbi:MAG TPA: lipoate--protein ligase family protein [Candidatus Udaeobacter sp.]|jgi:lipoate-protein ligase A|nr:lipoate--protein ligase family protein [Candidatus Udaeobacter sp.]